MSIGVVVFAMVASAVAGPFALEDRDLGFSLADWFTELPELEMGIDDDELYEPGPRDGWSLDWLDVVARIVVGVVVAIILWRLLRRVRVRLPRLRPRVRAVAGDVVEATEPRLPDLQRGLETALARLDAAGTSGDAIIAAWLALEEAAARSGVMRSASQTPTEFTVTILERLDAEPEATSTLLRLYHRARFAGQAPGPADVAAARTSLLRIAAGWEPAAGAGSGTTGARGRS